MRICLVFFFVAVLLSPTQAVFGLATERIGPDSAHDHPTVNQPGWAPGMLKMAQHDSRVYSLWVNGNDTIDFKLKPENFKELVKLFSEAHLRDHVIWIKSGQPEAKSFKGEKISYNVRLQILGGIALAMTRSRAETAETHDPVLTIYVDDLEDKFHLSKMEMPDNIILKTDIEDLNVRGKATQPERMLWHAEVHFDDGKPAADFEHGVSTEITLWKKGSLVGFELGQVSYKGEFKAAFSEQEIADLKAGSLWMTTTVGNWRQAAAPTDPKFSIENLTTDKDAVQPIRISRPNYYFGRILFNDGTPPKLDPVPWPGAKIKVNFSYAGMVAIDNDGFFKLSFTAKQLEELSKAKPRKNVYIPSYERKQSSRALYAFPPQKLSIEKNTAGVLKIARPGPPKDKK